MFSAFDDSYPKIVYLIYTIPCVSWSTNIIFIYQSGKRGYDSYISCSTRIHEWTIHYFVSQGHLNGQTLDLTLV